MGGAKIVLSMRLLLDDLTDSKLVRQMHVVCRPAEKHVRCTPYRPAAAVLWNASLPREKDDGASFSVRLFYPRGSWGGVGVHNSIVIIILHELSTYLLYLNLDTSMASIMIHSGQDELSCLYKPEVEKVHGLVLSSVWTI